MKLPIAVQLYSVRDSMEKDLLGTLKKVKEMGYDGVEFAGLFGRSPDYIKGILDALDLKAVSAHVSIDEMLADPDKTFADYRTLGCKFIAVPYLANDRRPDGTRFYETIDEIAVLGKKAKEYGLTLLYHNHDFEFKKLDGEYGLDILYNKVPAEYLQTELDVCWVNVGGEEPAAYIKKYSGRTPVVHFKDFYMTGKLPEHLYALIGIDDTNEPAEKSTFEFRPTGHGMQNFPAIYEAALESDAEWIVVEQDEPSMGLSRLECIKASIEYLRSI